MFISCVSLIIAIVTNYVLLTMRYTFLLKQINFIWKQNDPNMLMLFLNSDKCIPGKPSKLQMTVVKFLLHIVFVINLYSTLLLRAVLVCLLYSVR